MIRPNALPVAAPPADAERPAVAALLARAEYVRDLLRELVTRDLHLRYKRTALGILWSLLNPLAQVAVFSFVFRRVLPVAEPNYPAFVLAGVLSWGWFQTALPAATESITENADLVRRPRFPLAVLPAVPVASQMLHFLLALLVFAPYLALTGAGAPFTPAALASLPLLVALQFALTLGLGYVVAALHVPFRDTRYLLGLALMLLFYLTPVLYSADSVPERYRALFLLNPLAGLTEGYRAVMLGGHAPAPASLLPAAAFTAVLLPLGAWTFVRASRRFVEEL